MFGKVFWYRKLELQSWIPTPSRKPGYYKAQKTIHRCSRIQTRWEQPRKTNSYNLHQLFNPYSDLPYIHRTRCLNFRSLISRLSLLLMFLRCQKTFFLYVFSGLGTDIGCKKFWSNINRERRETRIRERKVVVLWRRRRRAGGRNYLAAAVSWGSRWRAERELDGSEMGDSCYLE